jgi:hypothetical protein
MKQQPVGYEVRVYANGSLREIEMFREAVDARVWAGMMQRRLPQAAVSLHRIGRHRDGYLCLLANLSF